MSLPSIFEKFEGDKLMWDIYSRQLKDRIIWLGSVVDRPTANAVVAQLLYLDTLDHSKDIKFYINSPGGSVSDGLAIYDTMNYIKCPVSTICIGQAASMGSFLLAAGAAGKRYALPNARMMIHQPSGGSRGVAADIEIQAQEILLIREQLNSLLASHTGQTAERIAEDTDRDYWMSADAAQEYGLIDLVQRPRKPLAEASSE